MSCPEIISNNKIIIEIVIISRIVLNTDRRIYTENFFFSFLFKTFSKEFESLMKSLAFEIILELSVQRHYMFIRFYKTVNINKISSINK